MRTLGGRLSQLTAEEIAGVLQHGAVIAREYGKPCVAGAFSRASNDGAAGPHRPCLAAVPHGLSLCSPPPDPAWLTYTISIS